MNWRALREVEQALADLGDANWEYRAELEEVHALWQQKAVAATTPLPPYVPPVREPNPGPWCGSTSCAWHRETHGRCTHVEIGSPKWRLSYPECEAETVEVRNGSGGLLAVYCHCADCLRTGRRAEYYPAGATGWATARVTDGSAYACDSECVPRFGGPKPITVHGRACHDHQARHILARKQRQEARPFGVREEKPSGLLHIPKRLDSDDPFTRELVAALTAPDSTPAEAEPVAVKASQRTAAVLDRTADVVFTPAPWAATGAGGAGCVTAAFLTGVASLPPVPWGDVAAGGGLVVAVTGAVMGLAALLRRRDRG